jgi:hypothetical protein
MKVSVNFWNSCVVVARLEPEGEAVPGPLGTGTLEEVEEGTAGEAWEAVHHPFLQTSVRLLTTRAGSIKQ